MKCFYYEPDDEFYDDDTVDADEEYPRGDDDSHPGSFASVAQIFDYYELMRFFDGEEDALGS